MSEPVTDSNQLPEGAPDDPLTGHDYDGIQEYDNPLPGWWKWMFVGSIVFSLFYVLYFHIGAPGRSVIEGAVEARVKAFNNIQIASFIDAGQISQNSLPDFSGDYQIGVGAGIRYLTPIGPIRLDIATPIDPRPTDRAWQLYISLGQPF